MESFLTRPSGPTFSKMASRSSTSCAGAGSAGQESSSSTDSRPRHGKSGMDQRRWRIKVGGALDRRRGPPPGWLARRKRCSLR